MAHPRPRVEGQRLLVPDNSTAPSIFGEPARFSWLEANPTFDHADAAVSFVAREQEPEAALVDGEPGSVQWPERPVPYLRRGHVWRDRLLVRLRESTALTLVIAPAGYGKTTLLAQWLAADAPRTAWVALAPSHDDFYHFWVSVLDALDGVAPGATSRARPLLASGGTAFLVSLLEDLNQCLALDARAAPAVLVLDDYHLVADRRVQEAVAAFVERLPPCLRLVLSARENPALPVARWRASGQLVEVRTDELTFTAAETAFFLHQTMRLTVTADTSAALADQTEGWAAGLQIAALGLRNCADPAAFIAEFRGAHRHVASYLFDEVIARQPAAIRHFLLRTAVLDRLCASLCDAVVHDDAQPAPDGESSQAMLEQLEAAGLFVVSLDTEGRWYRYHHLFTDVLLRQLRIEIPSLEATLRRRAATWYEQAGYLIEAIEHALAGQDWAQAAGLIEAVADAQWRTGNLTALRRWIAALPADLTQSRPRLLLICGAIAYVSRDYHQVPVVVQALETSLAAGPPRVAPEDTTVQARSMVLQAMVASLRGESEQALALGRLALAALSPDDVDWRAFLLLQLTFLARFEGDLVAAGQHAAEGGALATLAGNHLLAMVMSLQQAQVLSDRGRLIATEAYLARARDTIRRLGAQEVPDAVALHLVAALLRYERDDLDGAERLVDAWAASPAGTFQTPFYFTACLLRSRIQSARGDLDGALKPLEEADQHHRRFAFAGGRRGQWVPLVTPAWRAWLAARHGDLETVRLWAATAATANLSEAPFAFWEHSPIPTMQARAALLLGDPAAALTRLVALRGRAEAGGAGRALLTILALEALALKALGRREHAIATLGRLLALAEPEQVVRPFLDEGEPMADLLRQLAGRGGAGAAYARTLVARFAPAPAPVASTPEPRVVNGLVEPLTQRETDVLRLTADGRSNEEIAAQLFLSVGTVKWYLRTIYGKLAAERRTDAVAKARALGLLD